MVHISQCFSWFLDLVEDHFIHSDHPNASLIIDQVLVVREQGMTGARMEVLAQLMEDGEK